MAKTWGKVKCIICNPEARSALPDGARQITEELVRDTPPDYIARELAAQGVIPNRSDKEYRGQLQCWNCGGLGFTNNPTRDEFIGSMMKKKTIRLEITESAYTLLEVLTRSQHSLCATVEEVIEQLIDHAQQGVYRPGAWERPWLMQAFGDDWLQFLEPDPDRTIPGSIGGIGRNDMPFDRPIR